MALNIKNLEVEKLASEVASLTGKSKTEAIRIALEREKDRLTQSNGKGDRVREYLEREVWPRLPPDVRGKHISKEEIERITGQDEIW